MSSPSNPIGPPDPFEKYRVEEISEEKKKNEKKQQKFPSSHQGLASYIFQMLQTAIHFFLEKHAKFAEKATEEEKNLSALKSFLEILKREDRSQDTLFLNQLSNTWNEALEKSAHFKGEKIDSKFKLFMKKILHYPEGETHTFGYYLTEYAGQKWVPFPYMEMIQKIHSDYIKDPLSSPLNEWTDLLDEIILLLKE